jgi:hypothetical protein
MLKIVLFIMILLTNKGFCGSMHENIDPNKYLELGEKYNCVIPLNIDIGDGIVALGSGVIIDDNWVLTAAHGLISSGKVTTEISGNTHTSVKIIPHKDFNYDKGSYDIGLIKFDKKFSLKSYPKLSTKHDLVKKSIVMCGYGIIKNASDPGVEKIDMKIRAGTNIIESIEEHLYICTMSKDNHTKIEYIIAGGDSGGGLFLGDELIGINSCCIGLDGESDGSYNDQSGHTRVILFLEWIEDMKNKN